LENSTQYRTLFAAKDNHFDINLISKYHLQVILGCRELIINVLDVEKNKIVLLEVIEFEYCADYEQLVLILQSLWQSHPYLLAGFWGKVRFSVLDTHFCLVPEKFHNKNAVEQYYSLNNLFDSNTQELHFAEFSSQKVYLYFSLNNYLVAWLKNVYQNSTISINHQNFHLLNSALNLLQEKEGVLIYVLRNRFTLMQVTDAKITYINTFDFNTAEDFVYFALFALVELKIEPSECEVRIWGSLGSDSTELKQLAAYLAKVEMGRRICEPKLSYHFDELPESLFFGFQSL
jgi:hypothetical protein